MSFGFNYDFNQADDFFTSPQFEMMTSTNFYDIGVQNQANFEPPVNFIEDKESSLFISDFDCRFFQKSENKSKPDGDSTDLVISNTIDQMNVCFNEAGLGDLASEKSAKDASENIGVAKKTTKNKRRRKAKITAPRRKRKDIIFKSLLRRCRKYFHSEFEIF